MSSNSNMHGSRESYRGIVPAKPPNNTRPVVAEEVEGRPLTKENTDQSAGQTGWNVCGKQPSKMGSYSSTTCYIM